MYHKMEIINIFFFLDESHSLGNDKKTKGFIELDK